MNISKKVIWQQAAGDTDREYTGLCLKWGVILFGPGYAGKWPDCESELRNDGWTEKKISNLRRFAEEIQEDHLVVLRRGTKEVLGVGQIVGSYEWNDHFADIDGWDLQHVRRVRWLWNCHGKPKQFNTYDLKFGDTTQKLNEGAVTKWLAELSIPESAFSAPLALMPAHTPQKEMPIEEISDFLFDQGVASASITHLLQEIGELRRIAKWYERSEIPSEHETVAYLVVPLLRALGWTPQRMAVEWRSVDVALFERLPRNDETIQIVVEAKKMKNSSFSAVVQASSYTKGRSNCHRLIVTDGIKYGIYTRKNAGDFILYAYMNLARLMCDYPVYECKGSKDALLAMTPEWRSNGIV